MNSSRRRRAWARVTGHRPLGGSPHSPRAECGIVESIDDGAVDVVEFERRDRRPRPSIGGRWFAIVVIMVPAPSRRVAAIHQQIQPASLETVEVLLRDPRVPPIVRGTVGQPSGKVVLVTQELCIRHEVDPQLLQHRPGRPAHRLHRSHPGGCVLGNVVAVSLRQGRSSAVVDLVTGLAELFRQMSHPRQHHVQPLPMPTLRRDLRSALDEEHPAPTGLDPGEGSDLGVELVPEDPHRFASHVRIVAPSAPLRSSRTPTRPRRTPGRSRRVGVPHYRDASMSGCLP